MPEGSSDFPEKLDSLPIDRGGSTSARTGNPAPNGAESEHAENHNNANAAIMAIEGTLGVEPQGSHDDVAERLNAYLGTAAAEASHIVYVAADGDDLNSGLTAEAPITLQGALDHLLAYGPVLNGDWTIQMAAGTYPAPEWPEFIRARGYVYIKGAPVGTHKETWPLWDGEKLVEHEFDIPDEPTTIFDAEAGGSTSRGVRVVGASKVWVEDFKTVGFSTAGLDVDRSIIQVRNHWDEGSKLGRYYKRSSYFQAGGQLIENTSMGISELFGCTRAQVADLYGEEFGVDSTSTTIHKANAIPYATRIINPEKYGYHAKEHCNGHIGPVFIEDAPNPIYLVSQCVANFVTVCINGSGDKTGVHLFDSEGHGTGNIRWGYNTPEYGTAAPKGYVKTHGAADVMSDWHTGEVNDDGEEINDRAQAALKVVEAFYTDLVVTGEELTATKTVIAYTIGAKRLCNSGKQVSLKAYGALSQSSSGSGNIAFQLRLSGTTMAEFKVATPITSGRSFVIELELTCRQDGNFQVGVARFHLLPGTVETAAIPEEKKVVTGTVDMSEDHSISLRVSAPHTSNKVTFRAAEVKF